jgi:hypothetical protein
MDLYPKIKKVERKGTKSALHPDTILKAELNREKKEKTKFTPECVFCNYPTSKSKKKSKNKNKKKK